MVRAWPTAVLQRDIACGRSQDGRQTAGNNPPSIIADAGNGGKAAVRLVGIEPAEPVEIRALRHRRHSNKNGALLGARKASGAAEDGFVGFQNRLRRQRIEHGGEAAEYGIRTSPRYLLGDPGSAQGCETGLGKAQRHVAGAFPHNERGSARRKGTSRPCVICADVSMRCMGMLVLRVRLCRLPGEVAIGEAPL